MPIGSGKSVSVEEGGGLFISVRMKKSGIIFADNNPLRKVLVFPSLKTFVKFFFCEGDSFVIVC